MSYFPIQIKVCLIFPYFLYVYIFNIPIDTQSVNSNSLSTAYLPHVNGTESVNSKLIKLLLKLYCNMAYSFTICGNWFLYFFYFTPSPYSKKCLIKVLKTQKSNRWTNRFIAQTKLPPAIIFYYFVCNY